MGRGLPDDLASARQSLVYTEADGRRRHAIRHALPTLVDRQGPGQLANHCGVLRIEDHVLGYVGKVTQAVGSPGLPAAEHIAGLNAVRRRGRGNEHVIRRRRGNRCGMAIQNARLLPDDMESVIIEGDGVGEGLGEAARPQDEVKATGRIV